MKKTPAELFDLSGRVALVTGGSRGLGREMVLAFARAGADVVIASRKLDRCEAVAREVEAETGRRALAHACHVGRWPDLERLVEAAYGAFGKVDVLVNNAGMSPLYDDVASVSEALWDKVLAVNLKGPFRLTALVGTRMAAGAGGSIINVSSVGSVRPYGGIVPYAAAKAGLNAMTVAFAHTFGPKVRVNCLMPGTFVTDINRDWDWEAFRTQHAGRFALRRAGEAAEIVGAALYLASDASSYTTGAMLRVDGGVP
ncbi:MAG TPA: SDR family oxidoreductase [Candidatus Binatia bacterium]|nr:SDR family oxidoreductase [Candidatus Binatia bacterium]